MTQVETLIQQLTHAMNEHLDRATLERLANDYAAQCRITNRRLEQCLAVVQHGNAGAAVQLADAPPSLLDLVASLSFDGSEQWRQFCQAQQLPEPERLNERALSRLNELYGKAVTPTHPLYKAYREAMANRDELGALSALRDLLDQEPHDVALQAEVSRLEKKLKMERRPEYSQPVAEVAQVHAPAPIAPPQPRRWIWVWLTLLLLAAAALGIGLAKLLLKFQNATR